MGRPGNGPPRGCQPIATLPTVARNDIGRAIATLPTVARNDIGRAIATLPAVARNDIGRAIARNDRVVLCRLIARTFQSGPQVAEPRLWAAAGLESPAY